MLDLVGMGSNLYNSESVDRVSNAFYTSTKQPTARVLMGRPRTASNILEARGAFAINPQRRRPAEPIVTDAFPTSPPDHLSDDERACWLDVVGICPAGVLTGADTLAAEVVAVLLAEFRVKRAEMSAANLGRLTMMMGKLGLEPSGRASLVASRAINPFGDV